MTTGKKKALISFLIKCFVYVVYCRTSLSVLASPMRAEKSMNPIVEERDETLSPEPEEDGDKIKLMRSAEDKLVKVYRCYSRVYK